MVESSTEVPCPGLADMLTAADLRAALLAILPAKDLEATSVNSLLLALDGHFGFEVYGRHDYVVTSITLAVAMATPIRI